MVAEPQQRPVALSIAGSDSGGGAGIQADLLTFTALGAFGTTALTAVTAQNPDGVRAVEVFEPDFVVAQIRQVVDYFPLAAIKTGMLANRGIIAAVAKLLALQCDTPVVVDPVMVATSGAPLLEPKALKVMREQLFPCATLITPNVEEARLLLDHPIRTAEDLLPAARELARQTETAVLLKGGHLSGETVMDVLAEPGKPSKKYVHPRTGGVNTHGTGCTLASAVTAELALGRPLAEAVARAVAYLQRGLQTPWRVDGRAYLAH